MSTPAASPNATPSPPVPVVVAIPPVSSQPPPNQAPPPNLVVAPPVSSTPPPVSSSPPPVSASPPPVSASPPPVTASPPPVSVSPPPPVPSSPPPASPPPVVASPPPVVASPPPATVVPPPSTTPSPPSVTPPTSSPPAPVDSSPPVNSSPPPSPPGVAAPPPSTAGVPSPPDTSGPPSPPDNSTPSPPNSSPAPPNAASPPLPSPPVERPPALTPPSLPGTPPSIVPTNPNTPPSPTGRGPSVGNNSPQGQNISPPSPASSSIKKSSSFPTGPVAGVAVALLILGLFGICCYCKFGKKKKKQQYMSNSPSLYRKPDGTYYDPERGNYESGYFSHQSGHQVGHQVVYMPPPPPVLHGPSSNGKTSGSNFSYEELANATAGFSSANLLGEGGFGCVYKGILAGGQVVAVKQLKSGGGQGEREFRAEVETISRIHHRHLVTLVGYCVDAMHRLLVYEFVSNGTLEYHLHGKGKEAQLLDWNFRMKIAVGAARGLAYLHEDCHPRIIHRDIKSSNILLDSNFDAQVADFGLAKMTSDNHTHISTRVMGTFGYLAPEYAQSGQLTDKSDVYSFGVVLLEIVTGRKPINSSLALGAHSLVEWARPLMQALETDGTDSLSLLADPLLDDFNPKEMLLMVQIAGACVRHVAQKRPRMVQIVRALESSADSRDGPEFSGLHDSAFGSDDYSQVSRFRKMMQGDGTTQEYGSDGVTSEYGMNNSVSSGEMQSRENTWATRNRLPQQPEQFSDDSESEKPLRRIF